MGAIINRVFRNGGLMLRSWLILFVLGFVLWGTGGESQQVPSLTYDQGAPDGLCEFQWSSPDEPYLRALRAVYGLDTLVAEKQSELDKVQAICRWVHGLWEHNGDNTPRHDDPIWILQEIKQGRRFRCVEYAIVVNGCLNAVGVRSRILALKTEDMETRESGAGHIVVEAYLRDLGKWALVDGQWDMIPVLNGVPLNAVELQRALAQQTPGIGVLSFSGTAGDAYLQWIEPYLFYFDLPLDNRVGVPDCSSKRVMLVPMGRQNPTVFQRKHPLGDMVYTHSDRVFYARPY